MSVDNPSPVEVGKVVGKPVDPSVRRRRRANFARHAEAGHHLGTVVSLLGIVSIFLWRWYNDPRENNQQPFAINHLPHAAPTIAAAVILLISTFLLSRAGEALRQAGVVPGTPAEDRILVRRGATLAACQLIATAVLGVGLVAVFGLADPLPKSSPPAAEVWPALAALALSEAMCVAWAWEGAALAEDLTQVDEAAHAGPPQVVPAANRAVASPNDILAAPPATLAQQAPATGGPTVPDATASGV